MMEVLAMSFATRFDRRIESYLLSGFHPVPLEELIGFAAAIDPGGPISATVEWGELYITFNFRDGTERTVRGDAE